MPTETTNFGLLKPLVNNATDSDLWGGQLNTDMDDIDGLILTGMNFVTSAETTSFNVIAPTAQSITTGSAKTLFLCDATSGDLRLLSRKLMLELMPLFLPWLDRIRLTVLRYSRFQHNGDGLSLFRMGQANGA